MPVGRNALVWRRLAPGRLLDAWIEKLRWVGEERIVVNEFANKKTARIDVYCRSRAQAEKLVREFGGQLHELKQSAWISPQKRKFSLPCPPHFCVASSVGAIESKHRRLPRVIIPAGLAFGTGEHATTALCLRRLAKEAGGKPPMRVLDAGTGSGILALAAVAMGHNVTAFDNFPDAVAESKANAGRNPHLPKVTWKRSDVESFKAGKNPFDLLLANLFSTLLIDNMERLGSFLCEGGTAIISGVMRDQAADVEAAFSRGGLVLREKKVRGKWVCFVLSKG